MPTMQKCPRCLKVGVHSRLKRVYYRISQKYSEVGWLCPSCLHFYLDWKAYVEDYNRIFGTNFTVSEYQDRVLWLDVHIKSAEKLEKKSDKIKAELKKARERKKILPDDREPLTDDMFDEIPENDPDEPLD